MINTDTLEHIGTLTIDYYKAECERVKARNARGKARADHPCTNESFDSSDGDIKPLPCHLDTSYKTVQDWCEGCQFVQPYWIAYQDAAKKARIARYKLTRKIQRIILKEDSNE